MKGTVPHVCTASTTSPAGTSAAQQGSAWSRSQPCLHRPALWRFPVGPAWLPGLRSVKRFDGEPADTRQVQRPCLRSLFINLSARTQQPCIDLLSDCPSIVRSHRSPCEKTIKINTDRSRIITAALGRNKASLFPNAETIN